MNGRMGLYLGSLMLFAAFPALARVDLKLVGDDHVSISINENPRVPSRLLFLRISAFMTAANGGLSRLEP